MYLVAIAKQLQISERAARTHLQRAMEKLHSATRIEAVAKHQKAHRSCRPPVVTPRRVVYFIRDEVGGPVRIGVSATPERRLATIQTGYPHALRLIGTVDEAAVDEAELHRRFAHLRLSGEWFRGEPELLDYIAALADARANG